MILLLYYCYYSIFCPFNEANILPKALKMNVSADIYRSLCTHHLSHLEQGFIC